MNRVSGYTVYEKDGHMYVDMSVNVEEMFYDYSQEVYRLHKSCYYTFVIKKEIYCFGASV